ncbi:hypothetical protein C3L33_23515, partial [Rhododendron williamsianum]
MKTVYQWKGLGKASALEIKEILLQRKLFASITKGDQNEARKSSALLENRSETFSETVSVSGVMMKYFSDYEEVTFCSNYTSRAYKSRQMIIA